MIIVRINGDIVCRQMQLDHYLNPSNEVIIEIQRFRRVPIYATIKVRFKRKKPAKRLYKHRIHKLYEIKLDFFMNSSLKTTRPCSTNEDPQKDSHTIKKNCGSLELSHQNDVFEIGPFLNCYPYQHIDRFSSIPSVIQTDFCTSPLLTDEWKYYQEIEAFTGLFQDMIALNSFAYWDTVETEIRALGFHPKSFTLVEFIKWELLRHSLGIASYTDAQRIFENFDPRLLKAAFDHPTRIPKPYHASYYYSWLTPTHFQTFFQKLVEDCVTYKIIIPRIAIADGLIFRSWAGNFTLDRWLKPTDPGASITVHNKKQLGKCYNAIVFYAWCGYRWLPIDLYVITGNANENGIFQPLVAKFLESSPYQWKVFLYDSGACSAENREFLKSEGIIPGITARSNIKSEVILDIGHNKYCFADDIPNGMSQEQYKRLINHRAQEEAGFSGFTTYNHMKQMNTMGQDAATIHVLKYMILQLMHALAAYKVNRPDLLMMYSAFSALN
jgi:hypothetical protein